MGKLIILMMTMIPSLNAKAEIIVHVRQFSNKCSIKQCLNTEEGKYLYRYCQIMSTEFLETDDDFGPILIHSGHSCWESCKEYLGLDY